MSKNIKDIIDITKVDRQEAYRMYVNGDIDRDQLYDYLHERTMWLLNESYKNFKNE